MRPSGMKIAVYLPNWIGDAVMATPALRAVRDHFAQAEIVGILRPYVGDVLAGLDLVNRTIEYNPRGKDASQRGRAVRQRLKQERFDLAILFPNSLRTAWMAWRSGAKQRVGFARDGRGLLLTDGLKPKPKSQPHPAIDEYLRIAEHLGCNNSSNSGSNNLSRRMELATLPEDEAHLERFWHGQNSQLRERGVVCLNPGGAFGAAKHWPTTSFAELANRIASELGRTVLVVCGPSEREEARDIVSQAANPAVISLADEDLSLGLTKAVIRHSELLVTTDSGPRHFAQPFDVPVVTLFGPTHIAWSETYYSQAVHLQRDVDCGPCQQRVCPRRHHRCMKNLASDDVFTAVVASLDQPLVQPAAA
jgi:heptosyltransferase-2